MHHWKTSERFAALVSMGPVMGLAGTLLIAGCSPSPGGNEVQAWRLHDAPQWQLSETSAIHRQETLVTSLPSTTNLNDDLPSDAGAEDYVRLAVQRNPALNAAAARVRGLTERIPQVTSLEDPMLQISPVGATGRVAAGDASLMAELSQKIPFPGKLQTQGRLASLDVVMAQKDLEQAKLGVINDTRQAYWSYYFATKAIEVTQQNRDLLSQFRQVAEAKYKSNMATQQDVLRASVELSNLDNELITWQQRKTTAVAMLNSLLDRPIAAPLPAPQPAQLQQIQLDLDQLLAEAAQVNPELSSARQRIEAARQRIKLAQLQRWPDLTVGVQYNFVDGQGTGMVANGKDQWWLTFGINLPIWAEKLDAGEREARQGMLEGIADLTQTQNRVAFGVQDALVKTQTQQRLVVLFRDVIVPQAQQAVDASKSGYQAGNIDFLTLVDNWRKLLDYQLMYHQSLAELEQNYAQLQQAVGQDLPRQKMPGMSPIPSSPSMQPSTQPSTTPQR